VAALLKRERKAEAHTIREMGEEGKSSPVGSPYWRGRSALTEILLVVPESLTHATHAHQSKEN
jgi:hypothetical protein